MADMFHVLEILLWSFLLLTCIYIYIYIANTHVLGVLGFLLIFFFFLNSTGSRISFPCLLKALLASSPLILTSSVYIMQWRVSTTCIQTSVWWEPSSIHISMSRHLLRKCHLGLKFNFAMRRNPLYQVRSFVISKLQLWLLLWSNIRRWIIRFFVSFV